MGESITLIKNRATKTISAAKSVADKWVWSEKTADEIQAMLTAITGNKQVSPPVVGQEEIVSQAGRVMVAARGNWDTNLTKLHQWTVQGLGMAKNRFRNNPASLGVVSGLTGGSSTREGILSEALAWESAWNNVDPNWSPMPANTLAAFKILRKQCAEDLQTAYTDACSEWREQSGLLTEMGRKLEDINEAWYADATRVFPAGSAEGDMIRSTVPTTYTPSTSTPPPAPTPTATPAKTP